jgi:catalase
LLRLGGPNFQEIPINRPIVPVRNNQRDGFMRQTINRGKSSYNPNTIGSGFPVQAKASEGGFTSYPERIDARKIRARSKSFRDHFSQAKLFFNSQSDPEKNHIVDAFSFELGKVKSVEIRERMLGILSLIDKGLAAEVAFALRMHVPQDPALPLNHSIPADGDAADYDSIMAESTVAISDALSMAHTVKDNIKTRKIAFLAADGVDEVSLTTVKDALTAAGAVVEVIAPRLNYIVAENDAQIPVDHSFLTAASVFYDAVYVPGGTNSVATIEADADAVHFLNEAFKHCKAIAADAGAMQVLEATYFAKKLPAEYSDATVINEGLIVGEEAEILADKFILAISQHRFWDREKPKKVPA